MVVPYTLSHASSMRSGVERTRSAYNAGGHVIEEAIVVEGGELVTSYEVNELGLVTAVTDPRGNEADAQASAFTSLMRYDVLGRLVEEQLPQVQIEHHAEPAAPGRPTTRFGYDLVGNLTHQQDAEGHTSVFGYDLVGQQTTSRAPGFTGVGGTQVTPQSSTEYDALGRVISQTDARGSTRTYTWDQLGNLATITDPQLEGFAEAGQWSYSYNPVGELLAVTDPLGARTEATYDDLGHQVTDTQIERIPAAVAYTTRYTYDAAGNALSVADPLDNATTNTYNPAGELTQATSPTGETSTFGYDLAGRATTVTNPAGTRTVTEFDLAGRQIQESVLDSEGQELRTSSTAYDAAGLPIFQTDPLGHTTQTEFNALGWLTQRVEPVSDTETITTTFGYDALGQQTRITDGRGNSTYTTYTPTGQVQDLIEPATDATPDLADRTWTTYYDVANNPVQQHVPGGVVRERTFNAFGNLTRESAAGAEVETQDRSFGYDLLGRPNAIGTSDEHIEIVYDDRGNQVQFLGPTTVSYTGTAPGTTTNYDAAGRVTNRLDMTGTTTFAYDASGRVTEHHDPVTGTDLSIDYNQAGLTESITTNGGAVRTFAYDALSQLTEDTLVSAAGETTVSTTYTYDDAGRLTERTRQGTSTTGTHHYAYDHASRLISWTAPNGEETAYAWDASGNRTQAGTGTFQFDERNRLVSSSDGDAWSYNPDGTLSSAFVDGQLRTPQFDGFERMVSSGNGSGEYAYDALGRVAERTTEGGEVHTFVYADLENNPIGILDGTDTPIAEYGRDPHGQLVSIADQGQAPALAYSNTHGDLAATYTSTGSLIQATDYGPFGETDGTEPAMSLGYQGEWTDPDTGDVNMHARWYQPETGRFASRDTMTLEPTPSVQANRYTYANANPVLYTDPSGHFVPLVIGGVYLSAKAVAAISGGLALAGSMYSVGIYQQTSRRPISIRTPSAEDLHRMFPGFRRSSRGRVAPGGYSYSSYPSKSFRFSRTSKNPISHGGSSSAWAYASASGSSVVRSWNGFSGGRYGVFVSGGGRSRFIPLVDPRRSILKKILNTPQARPPIKNEWTQERLDEHRKQREKDIKVVEEVDFDLDDYSEYEDALENLDEIPGFEKVDDSGECRSFIELSEINKHDQRGTAVGRFCGKEDINPDGKDGRYEPEGDPPGYVYGQDNRAHLIASLFFGPGSPENIVATYARTNLSSMKKIESKVRRMLQSDQEVIYVVSPVYEGDKERPWGIHMAAIAEDGTSFEYCVLNSNKYFRNGGAVGGSVCRGSKSADFTY